MSNKPGAVANTAAQAMVVIAVWWLDPWLFWTMLAVLSVEILMLAKVWRKL